ncbi:MAG: hypothetical protein A2V85_15305 [Chloroflexi bacterium RBG_16_72_14]|nr:MAG: hypothetical protein A2V85_15305 [Chloroflexi bacterium RBG_16_72_14]
MAETALPDPAALAQATILRRDLGFDASPETVTRASIDRDSYPDLTFGVPMTQAEATEVLRRNQLVLDAVPAIERAAKDEGWAGAWIDHVAGGVEVFQFPGDAGTRRGMVEEFLPIGAPVRFQSVALSLADLEARKSAVNAAAPGLEKQGLQITGVTLQVRNNRIIVSVSPRDAAGEAAAAASRKLSAALGFEVTVREEAAASADHNCPASGCMPIKGGIGVRDDNGNFPCTVGYLAKRYDTSPDSLVAVTAGHCVKLGAGGYWQHGTNPDNYINVGGPGVKNGDRLETFHDYWNADVGVITTRQLSDANRRVRNLLLSYPTSEQEADVTGYVAHASQQENTVVCRTGLTTEVICGIIVDIDDTRLSTVRRDDNSIIESWHIDHTVVYRADALGGDSGGPVYVTTLPYPYSRYKATLYGTHVHSYESATWHADKNGWYSPIDRGIDNLEFHYPGVSLAPCVTATCGLPDPID